MSVLPVLTAGHSQVDTSGGARTPVAVVVETRNALMNSVAPPAASTRVRDVPRRVQFSVPAPRSANCDSRDDVDDSVVALTMKLNQARKRTASLFVRVLNDINKQRETLFGDAMPSSTAAATNPSRAPFLERILTKAANKSNKEQATTSESETVRV